MHDQNDQRYTSNELDTYTFLLQTKHTNRASSASMYEYCIYLGPPTRDLVLASGVSSLELLTVYYVFTVYKTELGGLVACIAY